MLKIKSILVSLLALGAMASCSTNELEGEDTRTGADLDVAYMSLRITLPTQKASTRAAGTSTERILLAVKVMSTLFTSLHSTRTKNWYTIPERILLLFWDQAIWHYKLVVIKVRQRRFW